MGDTGSLTIGGVIAVIALIRQKRAFDPTALRHFLDREPVGGHSSGLLQVHAATKPGLVKGFSKWLHLHHHYQKLGFHESKIVARFWIIGILLAVLSIVTLKIR